MTAALTALPHILMHEGASSITLSSGRAHHRASLSASYNA